MFNSCFKEVFSTLQFEDKLDGVLANHLKRNQQLLTQQVVKLSF